MQQLQPQQLQPQRPGRVHVRSQAPEQSELQPAAAASGAADATQQQQQLVGEDAAAFDWSQQSLRSWVLFGVLLSTVLGAMYVVSSAGGAHALACTGGGLCPCGRLGTCVCGWVGGEGLLQRDRNCSSRPVCAAAHAAAPALVTRRRHG